MEHDVPLEPVPWYILDRWNLFIDVWKNVYMEFSRGAQVNSLNVSDW